MDVRWKLFQHSSEKIMTTQEELGDTCEAYVWEFITRMLHHQSMNMCERGSKWKSVKPLEWLVDFKKWSKNECLLCRWRSPGTPPEASWVYPLVIRSRHRGAPWKHRQTGAQLLRAHGSSEWRQVRVLLQTKCHPLWQCFHQGGCGSEVWRFDPILPHSARPSGLGQDSEPLTYQLWVTCGPDILVLLRVKYIQRCTMSLVPIIKC